MMAIHLAIGVPECQAFNPITHEMLTRSAFRFLRARAAYGAGPESRNNAWVRDPLVERMLVRSAVDADFLPDLWFESWFHDPFVGGKDGVDSTVFTSAFHFINVSVPGMFWDYDGYSYRNSSRQGADEYLGLPGVRIRGDLAAPLGGKSRLRANVHYDVGPYRAGFKGRDADWERMFLRKGSARKAVFPPANVIAQLAYDAAIASPTAAVTTVEGWDESLSLATGWASGRHVTRHYERVEVKSLPRRFDLLGLTLHLAQDLGVPQHTAGTADYCHQELERLADRLGCGTARDPDMTPYREGRYDELRPDCQRLYDPALVSRFLELLSALSAPDLSVSERMVRIALLSNRWKWGEPDDSLDFLVTVLPSGRVFTADRCTDLMRISTVQSELKAQYNLAVAASVRLIDLAFSALR